MADDSLEDDYFDDGDGGGGQQIDAATMDVLMADESNRELAKLYMGIETAADGVADNTKEEVMKEALDEPEETDQVKVFFSDSEEEKEYKKKRQDLEGFKETAEGYTEEGQMQLFNDQVNEMVKRKNALKNKIKDFMASTFDPYIFSSISRLVVVEMLAYHQNIFERLYQESTLVAITSCFTLNELKFAFKFKGIYNRYLAKVKNSIFLEQISFVQIAGLFCKHIIIKNSDAIKTIIRKGTSQEHFLTELTAYEVITFFGVVMNYLGFKTRCCFLVSFDKLNLDASYKLDMYGNRNNQNKLKAKQEKKKPSKSKKTKKTKKKSGSRSSKMISDEESSSATDSGTSVSVTDEESKGKKTSESAEKIYDYKPLANSRLILNRHQTISSSYGWQKEKSKGSEGWGCT